METIKLSDGNSAMAIPENQFERSGYLFSHWYITDGKSTYTALDGAIPHDFVSRQGDYWGDYAKNSNTLTLIAQWECIVSDDYYEITVPTSITLKQNGNKYENTINVTATAHQRKWINVKVESPNNFNLVGKQSNSKVPYTMSETSFEMQPQYPLDTDDSSSKRSITVSTNSIDAKVSDDYSDTVRFEVSNVYDTRTIVLDCNGGNVNGESEIIYTIRDGSSYGKLPVPTKTGAEFLAWKDEDNNTIYSGSMVSQNAKKLTASYRAAYRLTFASTINGMNIGFMTNMIWYDFYRNGDPYSLQTTTDHIDLFEGDTFEVKNIRTSSDYYYAGLWSKENTSRFTYDKDEKGKVIAIRGTITKDAFPTITTGQTAYTCFNVKANSELSKLTDTVVYRSIVFDLDKPANDVTDVAQFADFESDASAYLDGTTLHVYNPNGGKVIAGTSIKSMLAGTKIKSADMRGLDTSNVVNATNVFRACNYLQTINVDGWNTEKVSDISDMFCHCESLKTINLNSWKTNNLKNMYELFEGCSKLEKADIGELDVSHVTTFGRLFEACGRLTTIDLSKWNTSSGKNMGIMFNGCSSLPVTDVSNFDTSNATSLGYMFGNNNKIVGIENFDTSSCRSMDYMFHGYKGESLDLSNFDTSCVTSAQYMFYNMLNIEELDLSSFDTSNLRTAQYMFCNSHKLKAIYVSDKFLNNFTYQNNIFKNCQALVGGMGTAYDPTFVDGTAARIDGGPKAPGYFTDIADKSTSSISEQVADQPIEVPDGEEYIEDPSTQNMSPVPEETPAYIPEQQENVEESVQDGEE